MSWPGLALVPGHGFAADEAGARLVGAGPFDRQVAALDHQRERVDPGLKGQLDALALPRRLEERHHYFCDGATVARAADGLFHAPFHPIDDVLVLVRPAIVPGRLDILPAAAAAV